jgi:tRNA modification GTPase
MKWHHDGKTIFALASGAGRAAVAVVRISGHDARVAIETMAGQTPKPRYASLRALRDGDAHVIDHALVLWFPGPRSFTGEDCAEFQIHGSRAVARAVLDRLSQLPSFRQAEPGEFARRAVANGKMSLGAAESLADLIDSETEQQRRAALRVEEDGFNQILAWWMDQLLEASAMIEAELDFADESDVSSFNHAAFRVKLGALISEMNRIADMEKNGRRLREGLTIVLAGAPNVGKSSLMNALADKDHAITSPIAGTTRDSIELALELDGYLIVLVDTAGVRETEDPIEREGVRRALARINQADLVLWLDDGVTNNELAPASNGAPIWRIGTKADIRRDADIPADYDLMISAKATGGLDQLRQRLIRFVRETTRLDGMDIRRRHLQEIGEARSALERCRRVDPLQLELAAEELRIARRSLNQLSIASDSETVLDEIFGRFCIGK